MSSERSWTDRAADEHEAIDAELRALVRQARALEYPATVRAQLTTRRARNCGPRIMVAPDDLRALLRGTMPVLPQRRAARARHARLWAALGLWQRRLPALAQDPIDADVLAAARQLAAALDAWIAEMAWRRATSTAGVSWPHPVSIGAVPQQSTATSVPDLFSRPDSAASRDCSAPADSPSPARRHRAA